MSATLSPMSAITLEELLNDMFLSSESPQLQQLHCETRGSQIILRGVVSTDEAKQLAQTLVRQACGMREIVNEIIVRSATV